MLLVFWIINAFRDSTKLLAKTTRICTNNLQFLYVYMHIYIYYIFSQMRPNFQKAYSQC